MGRTAKWYGVKATEEGIEGGRKKRAAEKATKKKGEKQLLALVHAALVSKRVRLVELRDNRVPTIASALYAHATSAVPLFFLGVFFGR